MHMQGYPSSRLNYVLCNCVLLWGAAVLKDVPQYPLEMLKQRSEESARMQLFPNLDYNGLFNVVVQLIDVTPIVQLGVQCNTFITQILKGFKCK